jgi:ferredoxin
MAIVQQLLFVFISVFAIWLFVKKVKEIRRNIFLGRKEKIPVTRAEGMRNVLLLAFGQKKMFKNWPVAVLHFFVYAGFIIINIEVLEIILDGILGKHRIFVVAGELYNMLINSFEVLAVLVILACVIFLVRRNITKVTRLNKAELDGWPRSDANYILIIEIILMTLFLTMNAADWNLQQRNSHYPATGGLSISGLLAPLMENFSENTLIGIERTCWWLHILGIYAFMNYLPYSKHLHIALAFPNSYYHSSIPTGKMDNMEVIQKEVLYAMQPELAPQDAVPPAQFGAKDVFDLSWKNLMDAYSCTECGRCSAACPANQTGKLLSPRKIMMDTRDRLEEVGKNINKNGSYTSDNRSLLRDFISEEELRACTTCNACVEECPVSISPLSIILQLRRHLILDDSSAPGEWNAMFSNIENNFAPWKFSPDERDKWTEELPG